MNDFQEMIREAFAGEKPYDPSPDRGALEAAIRSFERRDRIMRLLMWFAVTAMTVLAVWSGWSFAVADDATSVKTLILYATVFLWASFGIGLAKLMLFTTQRGFSIMKELKRAQLIWLEGRDD